MIDSHKDSPYWHLDLPEWYFEDVPHYLYSLSDHGILIGHKRDFCGSHPFSGNWEEYSNDNIHEEGIVHTTLSLINSNGEVKKIEIPEKAGRFYCFRDFSDFPSLACYPSIFEARKRLVSYCHCSSNWDGLRNSSIVTVDIESELFINQYWQDSWVGLMRDKIPGILDDVEDWSNGGLQMYLDIDEEYLLIHGDHHGNHEASLLFKWGANGWDLVNIIHGAYPKSDEAFRQFRIGVNSLTKCRLYE
jgi:hypothetical protein